MQKYTKIQASVQHGLYLFTCEISSVSSKTTKLVMLAIAAKVLCDMPKLAKSKAGNLQETNSPRLHHEWSLATTLKS